MHEKWQILGKSVWPNPPPFPDTYDEEIYNLKEWFKERTYWMDKNIDTLLDYGINNITIAGGFGP
ncbi:MAG: hypothetical protein ACFFDH_25645, partial [Promethearchaeota archaeon]